MFHSLQFPGFRRVVLVVFACCLSISGNRLSAQTPAPSSPPQDAPAKTDSTAKSAPSASPNKEISSTRFTRTLKGVGVSWMGKSSFGLADGGGFADGSDFSGASGGGEDGAGV